MPPVEKKMKATPARSMSQQELNAPLPGEFQASPSGGARRENEVQASLASTSTAWNTDAVQRLVEDVTTWQATLDITRMPNQKVQASDTEKTWLGEWPKLARPR